MTSLPSIMASSVPGEAAREADYGSIELPECGRARLDSRSERDQEQEQGRVEGKGRDDIVDSSCLSSAYAFDSKKAEEPCPAPEESVPVAASAGCALADLSSYPYVHRCPTITDTIVDDAAPGQLVFKRLRRDVDPPSPRHYNMMSVCMLSVMFLSGWNDSSQGPLLPSLREHYHLDYLSVGYIWICNFVGFLIAGLANVYITDRFGFGITIGYSLMTTGGPYPLFLSAFILNGFGVALLDALVCGLTAKFPNATTKTFLNYASYGFGATISPLISTQFVKSSPASAFRYYAVSLSLGVVNASLLLLVFRLRTADQIVGREIRVPISALRMSESPAIPQDLTYTHYHESGAPDPGTAKKMRQMFKNPLAHCLAVYSALYFGAEITIGGWAATFLQQERGGDSNVGYVSTGHFAGVTLGRLVLIPVANYMGKHNMVITFTLIAIALEGIIWTIPNLISSAVCFSLLGFFLAPLYPILIMVVVDTLPVEIHAGTIGWVSSIGCAGSALMPFITAAISNKYGIWILQPLLIAVLSLSLVLWVFVPRPRKWRA